MFFKILKTIIKLFLKKGSIRSFSQFGEDVVLAPLLRKKNGLYVDVGAFHPTQYSNTYFLYHRGWRGIVIDPNKEAQLLFKIFRPRDKFYSVGIGEKESNEKYFHFTDSAYNTTNEAQAHVWQSQGILLQKTEMVTLCPLSKILIQENIKEIDVLSIDAEGSDMQVLWSHNWNIPTHVIVIEDHIFNIERPQESAIYSFLYTKGFTLYSVCGPSLIFKK
ncbi:MAG: FkbM family methyltransferase [Candidatus Campbellbacteria bacterium]|nr:FkbM family methyltransferase [Candidatus Campbellbacteria bacterium]